MNNIEVGICIVAGDNYLATRYAIENLIHKTEVKCKLYIYLNDNTDTRIKDFCYNLEPVRYIHESQYPVSLAEAKNTLMSAVKEKYICYFPSNLIVGSFWLEMLLESYHNFLKPGIIGIRKVSDDVYFGPIMRKSATKDDYLSNVLINDLNAVEGLIFFDRQLTEEVGEFDEIRNSGSYTDMAYSIRVAHLGYNNFYIRKQIALEIDSIKDNFSLPIKNEEDTKVFRAWRIEFLKAKKAEYEKH